MNNILIEGSPGTGKTFLSRALAYYICVKKLSADAAFAEDASHDYTDIEKFVQSSRCEYIQVHPSMSYEDIVYGFKITASGSMKIAYAEKRVMQLCKRAKSTGEDCAIIFDDINRCDSASLLGDLIYAMEYRNQTVEFSDGTSFSIPDNVVLIFTEASGSAQDRIDYALRRRMTYIKQLYPDKTVLDAYYSSYCSKSTTDFVLSVFEDVSEFIKSNVINKQDTDINELIPGHGLFMVQRTGTDYVILDRIKQRLVYQVMPYIADLESKRILGGDTFSLSSVLDAKINLGIASISKIANVEKRLIKTNAPVARFSFADSKAYYQGTIIPRNCADSRGSVECTIDAMLLNEIIPQDIVIQSILTDTVNAYVESGTLPKKKTSLLALKSEADDYYYDTPNKRGGRVQHAFFSTKPVKTGRWQPVNDSIQYRVNYKDGSYKEYIPLNGMRKHYWVIDSANRRVHPDNNAADICAAEYWLINKYLEIYRINISLVMGSNPSLVDLYHLIDLELKYLNEISATITGQGNDNNKAKYLGEKLFNIRTLWNVKGTTLCVDENIFDSLVSGKTPFTLDEYEKMYVATGGTVKNIVLEEVVKMTDLKDYQQIMDNIGVRQMVFQGPPGTSKTFESKKFVLKQLSASAASLSKPNVTSEDISADLEPFKLTETDYQNPATSSKLTSGGWDLVQFHPSYGYEDFVRGIEVKAVAGSPSYESVNRILGKISEFARIAASKAVAGNPNPKFYLIIDEINRANLATVFGELIYGLEYRNSEVSTPYEVNDKLTSKITKDITVSDNLYIIGTMNTADKSIDSIDYAIRRRFLFVDSPSDRNVVIKCYQNASGNTDENSIELMLFDAVQGIFEGDRYFNEEYQRSDVILGHTYFLRDRKTGYEDATVEHFVFQVIPILREYVKDGILDSIEDLISVEHTPADIKAAPSRDEQLVMLGENVMLYVKWFGSKNKSGKIINNSYIGQFINDLISEMGY